MRLHSRPRHLPGSRGSSCRGHFSFRAVAFVVIRAGGMSDRPPFQRRKFRSGTGHVGKNRQADDVSHVITNYKAVSDYVGHWLCAQCPTLLTEIGARGRGRGAPPCPRCAARTGPSRPLCARKEPVQVVMQLRGKSLSTEQVAHLLGVGLPVQVERHVLCTQLSLAAFSSGSWAWAASLRPGT